MFSSLIKDWRRHYYHSGSDWLPLHIEIYLPATGAAGRGQLSLCSALPPPHRSFRKRELWAKYTSTSHNLYIDVVSWFCSSEGLRQHGPFYASVSAQL